LPTTPVTLRAERLLLAPAELGVPEVPLIGRYAYKVAHPPLLPHSHAGVLEICFLERGRQVYAFADGSVHCLRGGDMLAVQPGEVHGTGRLPEFPGQLYWFQLRLPPAGGRLLGLETGETTSLVAALRALPRQFRVAPQLRPSFEAALRSADASLSAELRAVAFKARMLQLLIACIDAAAHGGEQSPLPRPIGLVLQGLQNESIENLRVAELAKASRLSESYFKALFRDSVGMPPAEFLRVLRLERAQLQLRTTPAPITDVAFANGFSSSQHFATAFRKQYGCSPRKFRQREPHRAEITSPLQGAGVEFHPIDASAAS
jgi:AraC-like DNA-binding protein